MGFVSHIIRWNHTHQPAQLFLPSLSRLTYKRFRLTRQYFCSISSSWLATSTKKALSSPTCPKCSWFRMAAMAGPTAAMLKPAWSRYIAKCQNILQSRILCSLVAFAHRPALMFRMYQNKLRMEDLPAYRLLSGDILTFCTPASLQEICLSR
jgi:hypothetical protein